MLPTASPGATLEAPLVLHRPPAPAALLWPWLAYAQAMEARAAAQAAAHAESFVAPRATERLAATRLGAACGVAPWLDRASG